MTARIAMKRENLPKIKLADVRKKLKEPAAHRVGAGRPRARLLHEPWQGVVSVDRHLAEAVSSASVSSGHC
jgi:hypothetical protein